ncbi:Armadillo [Macleaya cordata]|uniref:GPI inositol-deacylase n=1 Tax=Macleaya cordata TaxID=56857 RepID=A0A200QCQ1_MACCD|nr:Armadillo [Macleaya cordata]
MPGFSVKCRAAIVVIISVWIGLAALLDLLRTVPNGCIMTYMYPTYIPISTPANVSSAKYGLFLYHEGWKKIDFQEHLKKLTGIPVLFIPGNGAESDRAYQGGPLEHTFYHEASLTPEEGGNMDVDGFKVPNQYTSMLDWFAVDLEGEHSAMDGRILEEHTEYVVYAIHRILDQYKESREARSKEGAETTGSLPRSVILVGHSMGGFVARAAIVHPHLRKSAVETVVTLSSPHQSPPVALQPSLGHYFSRVNQEWREGYEVRTTHAGRLLSEPTLSDVVVVSISGGIRDYQVRPLLESLDGIVPSTHGFMIGSMGMRNVWLSMEHQAILWCNQLVVQVSHTLLSLIDSETGQPFRSTEKRLTVFTKMFRSGIPQSFNWMRPVQPSKISTEIPIEDKNNAAGSRETFSPCPQSVHWSDDSLEKDLYIQTTTFAVLAMDGRRRWLDIEKLGVNGKSHFIFVTNLAPCSGVRLHLWPEKGKITSEVPSSKRILEVTSKMVQIPAGPAPTQIEPGSQTEQAPPSAIFRLGPEDMQGFRFLTISVAPRPTVSGRPPPAASMAVGQFFNPEEGKKEFSPGSLLLSSYTEQEMLLEEDHPLAFNLSFSISLGLLPVTLSLKTRGCGIKNSALPVEEAGDVEHSRLCKLRCFPPLAVAWDPISGLQIIPNLFSETILVDSSPAFWGSTQGSEKTTVLLMVDPHCSYKISAAVSITAAAGRFLLLYCSQIVGFSVAVIFFALMRQARAWELDLPLPSMLAAVESNFRMPLSFLLVTVVPIVISLILSLLISQPLPPFFSFFTVSLICYAFANGSVIILILISQLVFYFAAMVHTFLKIRWRVWEENLRFIVFRRFLNIIYSFFSFKAVRILRGNPTLVTAVVAIILVSFVHPALGLFILLLSHALYCHTALCSFLAASFRSHAQKKELFDSKTKGNDRSKKSKFKSDGGFDPLLPVEESPLNSPTRSYGDTQLEIFNYRHGMLMLHLLATLMFVPSLVAWLQRIGLGQSLPWFWDSGLCIFVIFHGLCSSKPGFDSLSFPFPGFQGREVGFSFIYLLAGYYCYLSALALAPYRAFYAMAVSFLCPGAGQVLAQSDREQAVNDQVDTLDADSSGLFSSRSVAYQFKNTNREEETWNSRKQTLIQELALKLIINGDDEIEVQIQAARDIRKLIAKSSVKTRSNCAVSGVIQPLISMLSSSNLDAVESSLLALLNLAVRNERNKVTIVTSGAVPPLVELLKFQNGRLRDLATAAILTLSASSSNKPTIAASGSVPLLVQILSASSVQGKVDAVTALYNLSTCTKHLAPILAAEAVPPLLTLLKECKKYSKFAEKTSALVEMLSGFEEGRTAISNSNFGILTLVETVEDGSLISTEHAVGALLSLCWSCRSKYRELILKEGAIPGLLRLTVEGTTKAQERARTLLDLLRDSPQKRLPVSSVLESIISDIALQVDGADKGAAETANRLLQDMVQRGMELSLNSLQLRAASFTPTQKPSA